MGDKTKIEWSEATWNPVTGCTKVSAGCDHCYAETFAERWRGTPGHYFEHGFDVQLRPEKLTLPLRWRKPRRIFVNSMSDLFHDAVPDEYIARVFAVMAATPHHTYQVLTKRHARMRSLLRSSDFADEVGFAWHEFLDGNGKGRCLPWANLPLPNVWLGVSVEDQKWADIRIPALLDTPAAVRFLSCEPLLGPVDLRAVRYSRAVTDVLLGETWQYGVIGQEPSDSKQIDWVIVGGESGHGARPMHPDWARDLRDQSVSAAVPMLFKQFGAWVPYELDAPPLWTSQHGDSIDGHYLPATLSDGEPVDGWWAPDPTDTVVYRRVGKNAAGRLLDGRTHDEYPTSALVPSTGET